MFISYLNTNSIVLTFTLLPCHATNPQCSLCLIVFSLHFFQLIYLRRFKGLRTLNLAGNPFCDDANYKQFVVAHIPTLAYLDFRLIDGNTVSIKEELTSFYLTNLIDFTVGWCRLRFIYSFVCLSIYLFFW